MKLWCYVFLLLGLLPDNALAWVKVIDGDSLIWNNKEIRLSGIDAPEYDQFCFNADGKRYKCGFKAKQNLKKLTGKDTSCNLISRDKYKRYVAVCYSGGKNVNQAMVKDGWAVAYRRYTNEFDAAEKDAKKHKRGIWQGRFMKPELFRILKEK